MTGKEELRRMIDDVNKRTPKLSDWERGFCKNIERLADKDWLLSEAQDKIFCEIWDRVTL